MKQNAEDGKMLEFTVWEEGSGAALVVLGGKQYERAGLLFELFLAESPRSNTLHGIY